jgi:hypothetical protein
MVTYICLLFYLVLVLRTRQKNHYHLFTKALILAYVAENSNSNNGVYLLSEILFVNGDYTVFMLTVLLSICILRTRHEKTSFHQIFNCG